MGLAWLQPAYRAGDSQGVYTSPAAAIWAAASLGLPPCLSTALRGVKPGSHRLLVSRGRRRAQVTRPENLAPGRHCEVTASGTLPPAPYGASPDTRRVRAATSAAHLKEVFGRVPSLPPPGGPPGSYPSFPLHAQTSAKAETQTSSQRTCSTVGAPPRIG